MLDHVSIEAEAVEINIKLTKICQFELEHFLVPPTADFGEAVVCKNVGSALRVGEVAEADAGDGLEGEGLSGEHATVAGNDAVLRVDQDRVVEAKLSDATGDLGDLRGVVFFCIARIRDEVGGFEMFDGHIDWRMRAVSLSIQSPMVFSMDF